MSTLAQNTEEAFLLYPKTIAIPTVARAIDKRVQRHIEWPNIYIYTFSDKSFLIVTGRGSRHRIEVGG